MQTVLAAVRSESFCHALADIAANRLNAVVCHDGAQVLEQVALCKPDAIILDMELPGSDGFGILSALRAAGYTTPVIALTSCVQSSYLSQMASRYGVDCIVAKPCTAASVLKNACELLQCHSGTDQPRDIDHAIELMLMELSFSARNSGYPCLVEAIKLYRADSTQQITKSLYPAVAKICGGSVKRVEHAMRCAIQGAWASRNDGIWRMYFPPERNERRAPANGKFIAKIAKCLENVKIG